MDLGQPGRDMGQTRYDMKYSGNQEHENGRLMDHDIPEILLRDGYLIPQIGLGVLRIDDESVAHIVEVALEAGYRHIDTAAGYHNEAGVGRGLAKAGFADGSNRQSVWISTKVSDSQQGYDSTLRAFDQQMGSLGLDYVDMYMIHWPTPFDWRSDSTWKAMARLRQEGRIRSLGVCNFMPSDLDRLYNQVGEYPIVNQIELHPTWQQNEVQTYCRNHRIAVEAYSPMARGADLSAGDGLIEEIALSKGVSPAQIVLRWHLENETIIIPKTVHKERMMENLDLFGFALTPQEHAAIDGLDSPHRVGHDPATFSYS